LTFDLSLVEVPLVNSQPTSEHIGRIVEPTEASST
jgi:hypothetical protein